MCIITLWNALISLLVISSIRKLFLQKNVPDKDTFPVIDVLKTGISKKARGYFESWFSTVRHCLTFKGFHYPYIYESVSFSFNLIFWLINWYVFITVAVIWRCRLILWRLYSVVVTNQVTAIAISLMGFRAACLVLYA